MGIQINGQTDTISSSDSTLSVSGYDLVNPNNVSVSGVITATSANVGSGITLSGTQINVGSATTIHSGGFRIGSSDLHSTGLSAQNLNVSGMVTATSASFSGNVSIAGTLTYEDVTNVDSLGIITARSGVQVTGGNLLVGTSSATGTASQPLQVTGGAYVSGNVGIGYTNPGAKLTVAGEITLGRTDSVNEGGQINFNRAVDDGFAYAIDVYGNTDANARLRFIDAAAGAERVTLDRAGNFIVGTSSSTGTALQRLQVTGSAYVSGSLGIGVTNPSYTLTVSGNSGTDAALINGTAGSAYFGAVGNKPIIFENNGTEKLRIAANGDINMGSASNPGDTLRYFDIYNTNTGNSAGSILRLITNNPSNSGTTSANLLLYRTGDLYLTNYSTGSIRLGNGAFGTDRLVIDSSGRITMPSQVYVYATSGTVSGTANPVSPPHFPFISYGESYDVGSNFNASTGVFTAPVTGKYLIIGTWSQDANTGRSIGTLSFNGNYEEWAESNDQYNDVTGSRVRVLAANDTVSFGRQGNLTAIAISIWLLG